MKSTGKLISRKRISHLPSSTVFAHEYCFFLHDQIVQMLSDYERAKAHHVGFKFLDNKEAKRFHEIAAETNTIYAMRQFGFNVEAKKVIINQITMGLVSDSLHHIFEALRCFEKRKVIVAFNLLRKPLTDSLLYLSWILSNEDEFYSAFCLKGPDGITSSILKGRRRVLIADALEKTQVADILDAGSIESVLFDRSNVHGFQRFFQHAVHLVTTQHFELRTTPENFNFVFKNFADDDIFEFAYTLLPNVLLFFSHVCFELFTEIAAPEPGAKSAFEVRSKLGILLLSDPNAVSAIIAQTTDDLMLKCSNCGLKAKITHFNASRIVLCDSFRCTGCGKINAVPFSWLF